ncbi:MAG: class I SAM-dependent methyltransferase [Rhodanobacter sp.]
MNEEYGSAYTAYQANRSGLRKFVRKLYLNSAAKSLRGPTLDFGCGVGELLARLPEGSKGLEYNQTSVDWCRQRGLDVTWYDGYADNWQLSTLSEALHLQSMVLSHVLEHLEDPMVVLEALLRSAARMGIRRILIIVPGRAGYDSDATHRTYIDWAMLENCLTAHPTYRIANHKYFPVDAPSIGDWFRYHELQVLLTC